MLNESYIGKIVEISGVYNRKDIITGENISRNIKDRGAICEVNKIYKENECILNYVFIDLEGIKCSRTLVMNDVDNFNITHIRINNNNARKALKEFCKLNKEHIEKKAEFERILNSIENKMFDIQEYLFYGSENKEKEDFEENLKNELCDTLHFNKNRLSCKINEQDNAVDVIETYYHCVADPASDNFGLYHNKDGSLYIDEKDEILIENMQTTLPKERFSYEGVDVVLKPILVENDEYITFNRIHKNIPLTFGITERSIHRIMHNIRILIDTGI